MVWKRPTILSQPQCVKWPCGVRTSMAREMSLCWNISAFAPEWFRYLLMFSGPLYQPLWICICTTVFVHSIQILEDICYHESLHFYMVIICAFNSIILQQLIIDYTDQNFSMQLFLNISHILSSCRIHKPLKAENFIDGLLSVGQHLS